MTAARSREILQALVQDIDPMSGEVLPPESSYQSIEPRVIHDGIAAHERPEKTQARKKTAPEKA